MYVNGEWRQADSGRTYVSTNPATGAAIGSVADGGRSEARRSIDAAVNALPAWRARTAYQRAEILTAAYRLMLERRDELAELMTKERGPSRAVEE